MIIRIMSPRQENTHVSTTCIYINKIYIGLKEFPNRVFDPCVVPSWHCQAEELLGASVSIACLLTGKIACACNPFLTALYVHNYVICHVIYHMSYVICHLSFVICQLSFVIRHMSFDMCRLSFVICHLTFVICHLTFVICHLSFVICRLSFVICHLSLVICHLS